LFGFFIFFSFKTIFNLKVVWENIVQNFDYFFLCIVPINWVKFTRTKIWIYYEL